VTNSSKFIFISTFHFVEGVKRGFSNLSYFFIHFQTNSPVLSCHVSALYQPAALHAKNHLTIASAGRGFNFFTMTDLSFKCSGKSVGNSAFSIT